jgi:hypothetical protein
MSLAKAVPNGFKDCEYKRITLCKSPPFPYVLKKDSIQEMVSALKAESLKTQGGQGTELRISIWNSRTHKAFLTHVGSAMDAIKKQGHFTLHN